MGLTKRTDIVYKFYAIRDTTPTLSASSQATGYPVDSLRDPRPSIRWKSQPVGTTDEWIKMTFTSAITVGWHILFGSNLPSGATVTVEGSSDGTTWVSLGTMSRVNDVWYLNHSSSYQYYRYRFSGITQGNQIEIGFLSPADSVSINRTYVIDAELEHVDYSIRRAPLGLPLGGVQRRKVIGRRILFSHLSRTDRDNLIKVWDEAGKLLPVCFIWNSPPNFHDPTTELQLDDGFYFLNPPVETEHPGDLYSVKLDIFEFPRV